MNLTFAKQILAKHNLNLQTNELVIGKSFVATCTDATESKDKESVFHIVQGYVDLRLKVSTTIQSGLVKYPSAAFDLKQIESCYATQFEVASNQQNLFNWIVSERNTKDVPTAQYLFKTVLSLLNAVDALYAETNGHCFLMDLSLHDSIFIDVSTKLIQLCAIDHSKNIKLDKQLVYDKYLDDLKNAKRVFLYAPEIFKQSLNLQYSEQISRKASGDVWAIGVIILLILQCDHLHIQAITQKIVFPTFEFSSKVVAQINELLTGIFQQSEDKRISLQQVRQHVLQIIELDLDSRRYPSDQLVEYLLKDSNDDFKKPRESYEEILSIFEARVAANPTDEISLNCLAQILDLLDRQEEAIVVLKNLHQIDKSALTLFKLGQKEFNEQNLVLAEIYLKQSCDLDSSKQRPLYLLGVVQWQLDKIDESIASIKKCSEMFSYNLRYQTLLAEYYSKSNKALDALNTANQFYYINDEYMELFKQYQRTFNTARLASYYEDEKYKNHFGEIGDMYNLLGDDEKAIEVYSKKLTDFQCKAGLFEVLVKQKNLKSAIEKVNSFSKGITEVSYEHKNKMYLAIARLQDLMNNQYQSISNYLKVLQFLDIDVCATLKGRAIIAEILSIVKKYLEDKITSILDEENSLSRKTCEQLSLQFSVNPYIEARKLKERYFECFSAKENQKIHELIRSIAFNFKLYSITDEVQPITLMELIPESDTNMRFDYACFQCLIASSEYIRRGTRILEIMFGSIYTIGWTKDISNKVRKIQYQEKQTIEYYKHSDALYSKGTFNLGVLNEDKNYELSLNYLLVSQKKDKTNVQCLVALSKYYSTYKGTLKAIDYTKECLLLDPYNQKMRDLMLEKVKDNSYIPFQKMVDGGIDVLKQLSQQASRVYIWKNMVERGHFREAREFLRLAAESCPKDAQIHDTLKVFEKIAVKTQLQNKLLELCDSKDIFEAVKEIGHQVSVLAKQDHFDIFVGYVEYEDNELSRHIKEDSALLCHLIEDSVKGPILSIKNEEIDRVLNEFPSPLAYLCLVNSQIIQTTTSNKHDDDKTYQIQLNALKEGLKLVKETQISLKMNFLLRLGQVALKYYKSQESSSDEEAIKQNARDSIQQAQELFEVLAAASSPAPPPGFSTSFKANGAFQLADAHYALGNYETALIYARQCSELSQGNHDILSLLAKLIEIHLSTKPIEKEAQVVQDLYLRLPFERESKRCLSHCCTSDILAIKDCFFDVLNHSSKCYGYCYYVNALATSQCSQVKESVTACEKALDVNPSQIPFRFFLSQCQLDLDQYDDAVSSLTPLVNLKNLTARKTLANYALLYNKTEEVLLQCVHYLALIVGISLKEDNLQLIVDTVLDSTSVITDDTFEILLLTAKTLEQLKRSNESLRIAKKCEKLRPHSWEIKLLLGELLVAQDVNDAEGLSYLQACLESESDDIDSNYYYNLGEVFKKIAYYEQAIRAYQRYLNLCPAEDQDYNQLAECIIAAKGRCGDDMDAENAYLKHYKINPTNVKTALGLSRLLEKRKKSKEASVLLIKSIDQMSGDDKLECYECLTLILYDIDAEKAIKFMIQYTKEFPKQSTTNYLRIGNLYHNKLQKQKEAVDYYMLYLKSEPNDAKIHYVLGETYLLMKGYTAAQNSINKALSLDKTMIQCHFKLASIQIILSQLSQAQELLLNGLQLNPTHALGLANLGNIYLSNKQYQKALETFEECMHYSDGRIPSIFDKLGKVYRKLKMFEESRALYAASLKALPEESTAVCLKYVKVLIQLKDFVTAKETLEKLVLKADCTQQLIQKKKFLDAECALNRSEFKAAFQLHQECLKSNKTKYQARSGMQLLQDYLCYNSFDLLQKLVADMEGSPNKEISHLCQILKAEIRMYLGQTEAANGSLSIKEPSIKIVIPFQLAYARLDCEKGEYTKAMRVIESTVQTSVAQNLLLCEILIKGKLDIERAVRILEQIVSTKQKESTLVQVRYLRALACLKQVNASSESAVEASKYLEKNPIHIPSLHLNAELRVASQQYEEANELLQHSEKFSSHIHLPSKKLFALVQVKLGNYVQSIKAINEHQTIMRSDYELYTIKGEAEMYLNKKEEAEESFSECVRLLTLTSTERDQSIAQKLVLGQIELIKMQIKLRKKHYKEAIDRAEQYLRTYNPNCPKVILVLANSLRLLSEQQSQGQSNPQRVPSPIRERKELEKGVKENPNDIDLLHCLGNLYARIGDLTLLGAISERLKALQPINLEILFDIGRWAYIMNDFAYTRDVLGRIQPRIPKNVQCLTLLLKVLIHFDDHAELSRFAVANANARVDDVDLLNQVSTILFAQKQFKCCIQWGLKIPVRSPEQCLERNLLIAQAMFITKQFTSIQKLLTKMFFNLNKTAFDKAHLLYQQCYSLLAASAVALLKDTTPYIAGLSDQSNSEICAYTLCLIQTRKNQLSSAVKTLEEAIAIRNFPQQSQLLRLQIDFIELENSQFASHQATKAPLDQQYANIIQELEQYVRENQQSEFGMLLLGKCYFIVGNYDAVIRELSNCLRLEHTPLASAFELCLSLEQKFQVKSLLGKAYLIQKNYEKAMKYFNLCIDILPSNVSAMTLIAEVYFDKENIPETLRILYQIIYRQTATAEAFLLYAKVQIKQDSHEQAAVYLQKALSLNPNLIEARNTLTSISDQISQDSEVVDIIESYEMLIKINPTNTPVLLKLLRIYQSQDDAAAFENLKIILNKYEEAIASSDLNNEVASIKAYVLLKQNRLQQAQQLLESRLLLSPHDPYLLFAAGQTYHHLGYFCQEIQAYTLLNAHQQFMSPIEERRVLLALGNAYMYDRNFKEAEQIFDRLLKNPNLMKTEHLINMGLCQIALNKPSSAIAHLRHALQRVRADKHVFFLLAYAQSMQGETKAAIATYRKCLEFSPDFIPAVLNLSLLLRRVKDFHAAELVLKNLKKLYPKHLSPSVHLACTYIESKSPQQAIIVLLDVLDDYAEKQNATVKAPAFDSLGFGRIFKEFVAQSSTSSPLLQESQVSKIKQALEYEYKNPPDLITINLLLADCYIMGHQYDHCAQHLESCLVSDPTNVYYCYRLAQMYAAKHNLTAAQERIFRCQALRPEKQVDYLFALSIMLHKERLYVDETDVLKECLMLDPNFYEAQVNLGSVYLFRRMPTKAIEMFEKALLIKPDDADVLFNLGCALAKEQKTNRAIEKYQKCLELNPEHSQCLFNLAVLLQVSSKISDSISLFQKYQELNPEQNEFINSKIVSLHKLLILQTW